eukprot:5823484-Pleurochrysis_carterae.AAC.1
MSSVVYSADTITDFESPAFECAGKSHLSADSADSAASHALADCHSHVHASLRSHGACHRCLREDVHI